METKLCHELSQRGINILQLKNPEPWVNIVTNNMPNPEARKLIYMQGLFSSILGRGPRAIKIGKICVVNP